jgi:hypothetical protein
MRTAIDVVLAKPNRTTGQLEDMAARVRRSVDDGGLDISLILRA